MYKFFPLVLLLIAYSLSAQDKVRLVEAGPLFSYRTVVDQGMSPLRYSGPSGGMWLGHYKYKAGITETFRLMGLFGQAKPGNKASTATQFHLQFDYALLADIESWSTAKRNTKVGGSWLTMAGMREHTGYANNNFNFEIATSPAVALQSQWGLRFFARDWWLIGQLHVPVVAATLRPAFAYGGPDGFYNDEDGYIQQLLHSTRIASWGSFQRILTAWALQYPLKNGNRVGLVYQWDYYRLTHEPDNPVASGSHTLSLVTYFNY